MVPILMLTFPRWKLGTHDLAGARWPTVFAGAVTAMIVLCGSRFCMRVREAGLGGVDIAGFG